MIKDLLHRIYKQLGPLGKTVARRSYAIVPYRFRKKGGFWNKLDYLRKSQWLPEQYHIENQNREIGDLISFAYSKVPYYQNLCKRLRIKPGDIKTIEELRSLPILTKSELLANKEQCVPDDIGGRRLVENSTSGSTGVPFKFKVDYSAVMAEEAFSTRHIETAGMRLGQPSVYVRSYIPDRPDRLYWYDPVEKKHYFSAYHLSRKNMTEYCRRLESCTAEFIFGYPSSLEILADFVLDCDLDLSFKAAITGSELLSDQARDKIERAFKTRLFDWYGLAEPTVTMGQCERGSYHLYAEYGAMELVDGDGQPVTEEGKVGRIIGTNFTNRAMPLIRYDTGDLGVKTNHRCQCGRGLPVMVSRIDGRCDDLLVGSEGQFLPSVNFYSLFAKLSGQVKRFQLVQKDRHKFSLLFVKGPEYSEETAKQIRKGLLSRIGGNPELDIRVVSRMEPARSGKIRAVIRQFKPDGSGQKESS